MGVGSRRIDKQSRCTNKFVGGLVGVEDVEDVGHYIL